VQELLHALIQAAVSVVHSYFFESRPCLQVALATYNEQPRVIFYLNDFYRIEDIRDALNRVTHKGGDTAIGKGVFQTLACFLSMLRI